MPSTGRASSTGSRRLPEVTLTHVEVTAEMVAAMMQAFADEIVALADPGRLAAIESDLDSRTASANRLARRLLGAFVTLAARQRRRS